MKRISPFILGSVMLAALAGGCAPQPPAPASVSYPSQDGVYIISPRNGEVVTSPVTVRFGMKGRGVAPANINLPNTGHHHLFIDVANLPPMNAPIPSDAQHVHFGGGQTEAVVTLTPGSHTLQLVLGDYLHVPQGAPWMSERVTITVK